MEGKTFTRSLPIREDVDILVAGGGPAGLAAAITAARQGCRVLLIENQSCLGGMGTAGMMPVFMAFGDAVHFYADGFGREVFTRMEKEGATLAERPWGAMLPVICLEGLKRLYDNMAAEAGVRVLLMTQVIAVEAEGEKITHAICAAKSGVWAARAKVFVDATGDGDLAAWAGAPFAKGDSDGSLMPATLCSLWADIDWQTVQASGLHVEQELIKALREDPACLLHIDPHLPGILPVGGSLGGGNVGHAFGVDGTDERSLTQGLTWCRKILPYYERFYRERLKGYERMRLAATAALLGVRETRRILGDYVLNQDDYKRQAVFDDEIGRFNYWIDIHCAKAGWEEFEAHKRFRQTHLKAGESYGIPYRTLTPRNLANILVAGRCVSTDRYLQASLRVMPGCFITGQAAGMAAAMCVEQRCVTRQVPIAQLLGRLKKMGAFLPNCRG